MAERQIRIYGDPVLREAVGPLHDIDGDVVRLVDDMIETMKAAPGVGLAATQIGVRKRVFVYDVGDGPQAILNATLSGARGEWTYEEGCLSIPGFSWPIVRPKEVELSGVDLDGSELRIEADEFLARVFQHEVDHLDGVLLIERLDADQKREALRTLRQRLGPAGGSLARSGTAGSPSQEGAPGGLGG